jgi:hypothetical protein
LGHLGSFDAFGKTPWARWMGRSCHYAGSPYETKRTLNLLTLPIALRAIIIAEVAIASTGAAVHKDRAFQASSPKNFPAGRKTGLFFGPDLP